MATGRLVRVRAYTEFNGETTVMVNPARARVVFLALRPEIEVRKGMPDPFLNPGVTPGELGKYAEHEA